MRKLFLLLLAVILTVSAVGCSNPDGLSQSNSENSKETNNQNGDIVEIFTEDDLFAISNDLSGNYVLKNDITLTKPWKTVGDSDNPFDGVMDGGGFTVYNMTVESDIVYLDGTSIEYMVGMFGVLSGTVKNLNIDSLVINVDSSAIAKTKYLSLRENNQSVTDFDIHIGFAGLNKGNIRNLNLGINYLAIPECETARVRIGGIAGKSNDEISHCNVKGDIKVQNKDGYIRAGGIAGYVSSNGIVEGSRADINILAEITSEAKMNLGGLIGNLQCGNITNCVATGNIKGINTDGKATLSGGLIGLIDNCDTKYEDMSATVDNCFSSANVISQGAKGYASGFIGQIDFESKVTVTNNRCSGISEGKKGSFGFIGRIQDSIGTKLGVSDFNQGNYKDTVIIKDNMSVVSDVFATQTDEITMP